MATAVCGALYLVGDPTGEIYIVIGTRVIAIPYRFLGSALCIFLPFVPLFKIATALMVFSFSKPSKPRTPKDFYDTIQRRIKNPQRAAEEEDLANGMGFGQN